MRTPTLDIVYHWKTATIVKTAPLPFRERAGGEGAIVKYRSLNTHYSPNVYLYVFSVSPGQARTLLLYRRLSEKCVNLNLGNGTANLALCSSLWSADGRTHRKLDMKNRVGHSGVWVKLQRLETLYIRC